MPLLRLVVSAALLTGGAVVLWPTGADACGTVSRRARVVIAGEEALIAWDPERRIEHFVRTASFSNPPSDFGFLVPTPTRPELHEVRADVFRQLFSIYRAHSRRRGAARSRRSRGGGGSGGPSVQVVEEREVAGMDAAVLLANDATALRRWLQGNGYAADATLDAWLEVYTVKGWYLTAYKIRPGDQGSVKTRAVRMSFQTDTPFYPYSEPQRGETVGRPLRISVVAPWKARADEGSLNPWEKVGYASQPTGHRLTDALNEVIPRSALSEGLWLTVFDEPASLRGTQDVFFEPAADSETVSSRIHTRLGVRTSTTWTRGRRRGPSDDPLADIVF